MLERTHPSSKGWGAGRRGPGGRSALPDRRGSVTVSGRCRRRAPAAGTEPGGVGSIDRRRGIGRPAWKRGRMSRSEPDPADRRVDAPRVALVHDWLTGMRGGEKCLEVLCRAFPTALLYTLIHRRGAMSPTIEAMDVRTSPLQHLPGVSRHYRHLLPLMPAAARSWRPRGVDAVISLSHCVAKSVRVPRGAAHVCYCFTPMRYAWDGRAAYLDGWSGRPVRRALAGLALDRLRAWDRETARGVTHFVAISETVRRRIARLLRPGQPGDPAAGRHAVSTRRTRRPAARGAVPLRLGPGAVQADRPRRRGVLGDGEAAGGHRRGAGAGEPGTAGRARPSRSSAGSRTR